MDDEDYVGHIGKALSSIAHLHSKLFRAIFILKICFFTSLKPRKMR